VEPDIYRMGEIPDKLLFCSDGLTNALTEEQIYGTVNDPERTPYEKVSSLIDAANGAGGPDNITVILAEND
jgi:protein phosphatase